MRSLNVWIVNPYGSLPGEAWREYRSTMLAQALEGAGHSVVWWVANFEHRTKKFRCAGFSEIESSNHFKIRIVPSSSYKSHISIDRIRFEKLFAERFYQRAREDQAPDVIVLAEPALFFSGPVLRLIRRWRTKLVVDVIDLWPELFQMALPAAFRGLGKLLFLPLYRRRAALFRRADALVAVSKDYLRLATAIAPAKYAEVVYWGIQLRNFRSAQSETAQGELPELAQKTPGEVWVIYAGTLGENYDIGSIVQAAELLGHCSNIRFLIAGEGPLKQEILARIRTNRLTNLVYVGNLKPDVLTRLYTRCDVALCTYIGQSTVSMPIKAYDYFAAGLPLVNSLGRNLGEIVREHNVGLDYVPGDAKSLAMRVEELASDEGKRRTMAANASRLAETFDWETQYTKYVRLIEKTVNLA